MSWIEKAKRLYICGLTSYWTSIVDSMAIVDYINIYCNSLMDLMSIVNEQLYICTEHIDYNLTTDIK